MFSLDRELQILRAQAGVLRDTCEHARTNFIAVMKTRTRNPASRAAEVYGASRFAA
jgi:hypothetical protein